MKDESCSLIQAVVRLAVVAVLLVAFAPAARSEPAQPQNGTNLLNNPGFETNSSGQLADGWTAWPGVGDTAPEYYESATAHSGVRSQQVKSKPAQIHYGGFYQQVSTGIIVGNAVSFSIWHDWPNDPKDGSQSVKVWIGLDPYGGTDPNSSNVVWTADNQYATDYYQQLSLVTTAMNTTVTVFTRSQSQYRLDAYVMWDDAVVTSGPWQSVYLPLVARNYVPPCTLQNGGFEGDYVQVGDGTRVAAHWSPWWNDNYDPDTLHNAKPEYNETTTLSDPAYRIHSGEKSQQYGVNWKHYQGGVYQQLTGCTVSDTLRFSAYGLGFAARIMGSSSSDPDGQLSMKVGIDPTGGTDYTSGQIQWSEAAVSLDAYRRFEITATVQSPTVTVFLYSEPLHEPIVHWFHDTSYWDDANLEKLP
jgi:hypothetical protein